MEVSKYEKATTEKLCPAKCQGMAFIIYNNDRVKCLTCKKISTLNDLLTDYG